MEKVYILEELDCANCAAKMEQAVSKIKGVQSATVNFMTKKLFIEAEQEDFDAIAKEADKKIKKIESQVVMREC